MKTLQEQEINNVMQEKIEIIKNHGYNAKPWIKGGHYRVYISEPWKKGRNKDCGYVEFNLDGNVDVFFSRHRHSLCTIIGLPA